MTGIGKEWKLIFSVSISLLLIIASCSENTGSRTRTKVTDGQFRKDTMFIHRVLSEVRDRSYSSLDQALNNLDSSESIAYTIGYDGIIPEIVFNKGNLKYVQNNYREANGYYATAIKLAEERNDSLLIARCFERMASIQLETDAGLALKLYYQALSVFEKEQYHAGLAKVYNILGIFKAETGSFDSAEVFLNRAIELNRESGNKYYLIENKGNLAYLYEQRGDLIEARKIYLDLANELIEMKDSISLQIIYLNLAGIFEKEGNKRDYNKYLWAALMIAEPSKDTSVLATLYGRIGEKYLKRMLIDSATFYLEKSVIFSRAIGELQDEKQALTLLTKIDSMKGDFKSAYLKTLKIGKIRDSISQRRMRNDIKTTELNYAHEKTKIELELKKLAENSMRKEKLLFIVLFLISVTAIVLLGFVILLQKKNYFKNRKIIENELQIKHLELEKFQNEKEIDRLKLEKVNQELRAKDRELVSIALGADQKNEFLEFLSKKIKDAEQQKAEKDPLMTIREIVTAIRMQLKESGETELFTKKFTLIHDHFYQDLKFKHPSLTKTELRFCAYLKIHLSGNQIAKILNVTLEAIRKTRYRLRKKMNLPTSESLEDYISRF